MPALTTLETKLASPSGELVRGDLLKSLGETEHRLRQAIAARLPRDEYACAAALLDATQAAQEVLHRYPIRSTA